MAGNDRNEATTRAEQLLGRAFEHLRGLHSVRAEDGFFAAFPDGLDEIEIRVDVRVSEAESAAVALRVRGRNVPPPDAFDYDEFEDPLLYENDETP